MEHAFVYSVDWVKLVFSSGPIAEELLLPEREAGNLTYVDYEKALDFLPRARRYAYRPVEGLIFFSLAGFGGIRYRRLKWTSWQKTAFISSLGFTGFTLGNLSMIKAHTQFLHSIENKRGFFNAIRNIESRTGLHNHLTRGPRFTTILGNETETKMVSSEDLGMVPIQTSQQTERGLSRWDAIRMANIQPPFPPSRDTATQGTEKEILRS